MPFPGWCSTKHCCLRISHSNRRQIWTQLPRKRLGWMAGRATWAKAWALSSSKKGSEWVEESLQIMYQYFLIFPFKRTRIANLTSPLPGWLSWGRKMRRNGGSDVIRADLNGTCRFAHMHRSVRALGARQNNAVLGQCHWFSPVLCLVHEAACGPSSARRSLMRAGKITWPFTVAAQWVLALSTKSTVLYSDRFFLQQFGHLGFALNQREIHQHPRVDHEHCELWNMPITIYCDHITSTGSKKCVSLSRLRKFETVR